MSTFAVKVVKIDSVEPHPNADRLDLVAVNDWRCVSQKGLYKPGDLAIYFPIDSVLPPEVESKIFGPESKVKLTNSRVRTIKLRGAISQGLVCRPEVLGIKEDDVYVGNDLTEVLNITKYYPVEERSANSVGPKSKPRATNPNFRKYTGIENAKNYPKVFEDDEHVVISEKIHGTNFRAGYVPFYADTLWKKLKSFLGLAPKYEFVYGSHNVQLQSKLLYKGFYETNLYAEAVKKYNLEAILAPGEVVYGEVYGDGVQKGYTYGCKPGERKLVLFDLMVDGKYEDPVLFKKWAEHRQLPVVPYLFSGPFSKEKVLELRDGWSVLSPSQKVREGVVVKPLLETTCFIGRKMLKFVSDEYLLKNQDEETLPH